MDTCEALNMADYKLIAKSASICLDKDEICILLFAFYGRKSLQ